MMPFVRGVNAVSTPSGSRHHVERSMSTNTGFAPTYRTAFAVATYVSDGTMTSSPGPAPSASKARWSAAVPLETESALRTPQSSANVDSNRETKGPVEEIHEL